jgi:hypothetical protein
VGCGLRKTSKPKGGRRDRYSIKREKGVERKAYFPNVAGQGAEK